MTSLPKLNPLKLKCAEQASRLSLGDMARKVDELVKEHNSLLESLKSKEEIDKTWLKDLINKDPKLASKPNYEEASKGECGSYETAYKGRTESEQIRYDAIVGKIDPPQQEESPKEDEKEKIKRRERMRVLRKLGEKFSKRAENYRLTIKDTEYSVLAVDLSYIEGILGMMLNPERFPEDNL